MNDLLQVSEIFESFQGEGDYLGVSSLFIRIAGCSVGCKFCDEKKSWKVNHNFTVDALDIILENSQADILTITGGEPLEHPEALNKILSAAYRKFKGWCIVIETSCNYPLDPVTLSWLTKYKFLGLQVTFSLSPKKHPSSALPLSPLGLREAGFKVYAKIVCTEKHLEDYIKNHFEGAETYNVYIQPEYTSKGAIGNSLTVELLNKCRELAEDTPCTILAGIQAHKHWGFK